MGEFSSFQEVLDILHANDVKYLILRNYDNLLMPEMYQNGHGDVDMLCEDSMQIVNLLHARCYEDLNKDLYDDKTHYFILIDGKRVKLDLRHVGDGYYCEEWQNDMLNSRELSDQGFFILDKENMLYSIIYHAIIQKDYLSKEYDTLIKNMLFDLDLAVQSNGVSTEKQYILLLEHFMKSKNYVYTYPVDRYVPLNRSLIDKTLIKKGPILKRKHDKYEAKLRFKARLVRIKHFLKKCCH